MFCARPLHAATDHDALVYVKSSLGQRQWPMGREDTISGRLLSEQTEAYALRKVELAVKIGQLRYLAAVGPLGKTR